MNSKQLERKPLNFTESIEDENQNNGKREKTIPDEQNNRSITNVENCQ